ncbi:MULTISPECIES: SDR family oxidoreductase [Actinomadura]
MTILVTGATGNVGRHVVEELLGGGHKVRALTRDPARALVPAGVEVAAGDLAVPDSLASALEGVTAMHPDHLRRRGRRSAAHRPADRAAGGQSGRPAGDDAVER